LTFIGVISTIIRGIIKNTLTNFSPE